jgi:hypothetical protein
VNRIMRTRLLIILMLSLLGVTALAGWQKFLSIRVRVALAEEQTRYFSEACAEAARSGVSAARIRELMEGVVAYYPSGSKQVRGSHLDTLVERARGQALAGC